MRKIITLLWIIFSIPVLGQEHYIGIKSGLNWTDVNSINFLRSNLQTRESRIGFNGGLMYQYHFNEKFNLGIDFLYSQKGFTQKIGFLDGNGNPFDQEENSKFNYDYLSFPIKGGIVIGDQLSGFANLGLTPSVLINAAQITTEIEGVSEEIIRKITNKVSRFDIGGIVEIGANYSILDSVLLFTSIGYQISFTSITNDNYFASAEVRHYGIILSFGLKYVLIKD